MTRLAVTGGIGCVAVMALSACSSGTAQNSVSYQRYTFTCCQDADTQRVWVPGETLTLHWVAEPAGATSDTSAQRVRLTAVLSGPYPSVNALKAGGSSRMTLSAAAIVTTDRANTNAVSSILLPVTLPAGFYNIASTMELAGGKTSGASVIQVSPAPSH